MRDRADVPIDAGQLGFRSAGSIISSGRIQQLSDAAVRTSLGCNRITLSLPVGVENNSISTDAPG